MTEWAQVHISLLIEDCCHALLSKALQILEGITLYNAAVVFTPRWFSSSQNYNTLLLFKFYLSNELIEIKEIATYLETPIDTILFIGAKILNNYGSDEDTMNSINSADITTSIFLIKKNLTSSPKPSSASTKFYVSPPLIYGTYKKRRLNNSQQL
jgi:hypothetical protein